MDLEFTEEQELLRETVRGVCARHCGLDVVRALEDDPVGYPEKLWLQLIELGLLDSELTMLDKAIVFQELGRALAPSPAFARAVSADALARTGRTISSDVIIVPAWLEPERGFGPNGVAARIDNGRLSGVKRHVPFASSAEQFLVLTRDGLALVDDHDPGVTLTQQMAIASDTQYRVDFDGADAEVVATDVWPIWDATMHDAIILAAAQAVGGAR